MTKLNALLLGSAGRPALMLDAWGYAARVLDRGDPPWTETAALVSLARRSVGLLRPDILPLPMLAWFTAHLDANPRLREAMGKRKRTAFALKTALADAALRSAFVEVVSALCTALPGLGIVPALAAPARWLLLAYTAAHGDPPDDIDDDMCEQAEVFLADLLREISAVPIAGLLIDEPQAEGDAAWAGMHTPVFNVCVHYRWSVGAELKHITEALPLPVAWFIGSSAHGGLPRGVRLDAEFWNATGAPTARSDFYVARLPPDSQPETVLARLAALRELHA
jgi:hypothetical protein